MPVELYKSRRQRTPFPASTSWTEGAFIHFALYEAKDQDPTGGAQVAFRVDDLQVAHSTANVIELTQPVCRYAETPLDGGTRNDELGTTSE